MNGHEELAARYFPITSQPLRHDGSHSEVLPCAALRPFIRCFWGSSDSLLAAVTNTPVPVIPDTCMDIIIRTDMQDGSTDSVFCAADDSGYYSERTSDSRRYSVFGVRFYAWTAAMFTDADFSGSCGLVFDPDEFFTGLKAELISVAESTASLEKRARATEVILAKRLDTCRVRADLMNAVYDIAVSRGRIRTDELAAGCALSKRQLERIFSAHTGISPKSMCSLMRYQMLWQDIFFGRGSILDLAEKYGYYDQAHLLNDFRRRHLMTPSQAAALARG